MTFDLARLEPKNLWGMISDFAGSGCEFGHVCKSWNHFRYLRFAAFCEKNETLKEYLELPYVQALPIHKRMLAIYHAIIAKSKEAVNKKLPPNSEGTFDADAAADGIRLGKIRGAIQAFHPDQWVALAEFTKQMESKWHPEIQARPATPPILELESHEEQEEQEAKATLSAPISTFNPPPPFSLATEQNGWLRQASSSGDSEPEVPVSPPAKLEEPNCLQSFQNWCCSWCSYFTKQITDLINWLRGVT